MNDEIVKKWIAKAENDLKIGKDELETQKPVTDMICFHMQQCIEKSLKAFLIFHGKEITKSHNLALLIQNCIEIDSDFKKLLEMNAHTLTDYAVEARYPDDFYMPSAEETERAVEIADAVKQFVLKKFKFTKDTE